MTRDSVRAYATAADNRKHKTSRSPACESSRSTRSHDAAMRRPVYRYRLNLVEGSYNESMRTASASPRLSPSRDCLRHTPCSGLGGSSNALGDAPYVVCIGVMAARRSLGGGRVLGNGKNLAPPVANKPPSRPTDLLSPSESSVSLNSQASSTPLSTDNEDLTSRVALGDHVSAQATAAASSRMVCPICNEEMVGQVRAVV